MYANRFAKYSSPKQRAPSRKNGYHGTRPTLDVGFGRPRLTGSPTAGFAFSPIVSSFALRLPPIILLLPTLHRVLLERTLALCLKRVITMRHLRTVGSCNLDTKLALFDCKTALHGTAFNYLCSVPVLSVTFGMPALSGLLTPDLISLTNCSTAELMLALKHLFKFVDCIKGCCKA